MLWVLGATASMGVHERARVKESKWRLGGGAGAVVCRMCVEDGDLSREAERRRRHCGGRACELQTVREEEQRPAARPNPSVPSRISQSTAVQLSPPLVAPRARVPGACTSPFSPAPGAAVKVRPLSLWTCLDTHDPQPTLAYPLLTVSRAEMTSSVSVVLGLLWALD